MQISLRGDELKGIHTIPLRILLIAAFVIGSCAKEPPKPEGVLDVTELLDDPKYESEIKVYGQVSGLGEFECTCFALKSEGERIYVWYDMMVEEEGSVSPSMRPPIDIEVIKNDDWIVVTGELKYFENRLIHEDFWLVDFEVIR